MLVKEVMQTAVGVEQNITLKRASEIMSDKNITNLFIIEENHVVGVIDEGHMVEYFGTKKTVSEVMDKNVTAVLPDDDIDIAREVMMSKHVSVVPVVDPTDGLVGVVTSEDILKASEEGDHFLVD